MVSYFQKLGEQVEEEIKPYVIKLFELYVENNAQINREIEYFAEQLSSCDRGDIFENIPSQEVREGVAHSTAIYFHNVKEFSQESPTLKQAKDLLNRLK